MDANRKFWNQGQQKLRLALEANSHKKILEQFLIQHAMVHSKTVSQAEVWSFEADLWQGLNMDAFRTIPPTGEHSIAWILFHIARIEDITMNMLAAGVEQLYTKDGWAKKINSTIQHSANEMDHDEVFRLSASINLNGLRDYRNAVGCQTREIVKGIALEELSKKMNPARLQRVLDEGAVCEEAIEIVNYWGKRTIAGLLLMPPTRHNFLHLNEAMRIKQKLR